MSAKRPGEMLEALLLQRGITPTEFGRRMGSNYLLARRWIKGEGFDRSVRNQAKAAKEFGVPPNYFRSPDLAERRETIRRREFERFCTTELGQSMSVEEYASLNSIQLFVDAVPTVAYYQIQLGLLRNNLPRSVADEATRMNDRADAENARASKEKQSAEEARDLVAPSGDRSRKTASARGASKAKRDALTEKRPRKSPQK